ncbi:MAG TPA: hypothetical protein PK286_06360 [Devosia sp.]|nr:hypothetical protein [Devosia sp.]
MRKSGLAQRAAIALSIVAFSFPAFAQDQQVQILRDAGLTDDLPYTIYYPNILQTVDDGNAETILTLRPSGEKFFQCDVFAVPSTAQNWTAEEAAKSLDVAGIEASWSPDFPGFKLVQQGVAAFSSGPALHYEGQSDNSPVNVPINVIHAEAVDGGRTYAIECVYDRSIDADARPVVEFIIANFSARSDGECCINPTDDRG